MLFLRSTLPRREAEWRLAEAGQPTRMVWTALRAITMIFQLWRISMRASWFAFAVMLALTLSGCGYNTLQSGDEQIKASWSEVLNQYQRRADLVPNLVNTVKGFAAQEKDVFLGVGNARAKVSSIQASPELINDPQALAKFEAAQGELSSALSKLLVVSENYPQLKSDANFRDLQSQLEGTENGIT